MDATSDRARNHLPADVLLEEIARDHRSQVTAYVRRLLGDHHLAEDVVQETFVRAWKHADALQRGNGSLRAWLLTVARNISIDKMRSAVGRHEFASDESFEGRSASTDHATAVVGDDVVRQLLDSLSPEQRSVVFLSVIVGLTSGETAERLGVPAGTVKSRKHYALRELRQRLESVVEGSLAA